jgi:hypothetical protein
VTEPTTAITDCLLAACTAFWALMLFRRAEGDRRVPLLLWAAAFAATAAGALAGAAWHGLRPLLGVTAALIVWKATLLSIGLASFALGSAVAFDWLPRAARIATIALLGAQFCWYAAVIAKSDDFSAVVADYSIVMIGVLIAALVRVRERAARWIIGGILVSFAAAAVEMSSLRIGSLTHDDVYHLIEIGGLFMLYRGAVTPAAARAGRP